MSIKGAWSNILEWSVNLCLKVNNFKEILFKFQLACLNNLDVGHKTIVSTAVAHTLLCKRVFIDGNSTMHAFKQSPKFDNYKIHSGLRESHIEISLIIKPK